MLPTVADALAQGRTPAAGFEVLAAWFGFLRQVEAGGIGFAYEEPMWEQLRPLLAPGREGDFAASAMLWGAAPQRHPAFAAGSARGAGRRRLTAAFLRKIANSDYGNQGPGCRCCCSRCCWAAARRSPAAAGRCKQELSQLESEYGEVVGNLARGYALHVQYVEEQEPYTEVGADGKKTTLWRTVHRRVETPVAIDIDDQQRRASSLRRSIDRLAGPAESEVLRMPLRPRLTAR